MSAFTGLNTINCLTCIAIDRFLAVTRRRTKRRTASMVGISLASALTWAALPLCGWSRYIGEGFLVNI
jgi:hypothetical protein